MLSSFTPKLVERMTMSKFVVSANYRDRQSPYKWLVRRVDEPIDKAVACEFVRCSGVTFGDSNKEEKGFGCNRVAFCENVSINYPEVETDLPKDPIRIPYNLESNNYVFDGYNICRTVPVNSVEMLRLSDNGKMWGYGKTTDLEV